MAKAWGKIAEHKDRNIQEAKSKEKEGVPDGTVLYSYTFTSCNIDMHLWIKCITHYFQREYLHSMHVAHFFSEAQRIQLFSGFKCNKPCQMKLLSLPLWGGLYGKVSFVSVTEVHSAHEQFQQNFNIRQAQLWSNLASEFSGGQVLSGSFQVCV